jgi:hypothetical protein
VIQVHGWVLAGKVEEIMHEMGLVEIPARARDVRPIHGVTSLNPGEDLLKAANPAKQLGRQSSFAAKELNKMFMTEAKLL